MNICLHRKEQGDTWHCYTLCMDDIKAVADRKGLSLEEIDLEDIIHYIKKGIECALDNRDEIIEMAIRQARSIEQDYGCTSSSSENHHTHPLPAG